MSIQKSHIRTVVLLSGGLDSICRIGQSLKVPYEETWSCYKGKDIHCGTCCTCHERRSAFIDAGILDPTVYQATQQMCHLI